MAMTLVGVVLGEEDFSGRRGEPGGDGRPLGRRESLCCGYVEEASEQVSR